MSGSEILVVLNRPDAAAGCLRAAADAARALPSPHLSVLYVHPDPAASILTSEEVLTDERRAVLEQRAAADRAALQAAWTDWKPAAPDSDWIDATGVPADEVRRRATGAALVVMALPGLHPPHLEREAFDAVLFAGHRPVLAVPTGWAGQFGRHLAVGWRDSPSTRGALAGLQPWLAAAAQVTAIEVADHASGTAPAMPSGWQGAFAVRTVAPTDAGDGAMLLDAAATAGADGLVLGAYRRGRFLEWVLGGVTENVLHYAHLPLLLKH